MHWQAIRNWLAIALLTLALVLAASFLGREDDSPSLSQISSSVRSGDVVLLEGTSIRGRIVQWLNSKSDFSHVGIVKVEDGKIFLIHADPLLGCVQEEMHQLFARCRFRDALVLRPNDAAAALKAVAFCSQAVARHATFNDSFRYLQGSGYYCTELVLLAYDMAGARLLSGTQTGAILFPEELIESRALARVQGESSETLKGGFIIDDLHRPSTQNIRRPHDHRITDLLGDPPCLLEGGCCSIRRLDETELIEEDLKTFPVLC